MIDLTGIGAAACEGGREYERGVKPVFGLAAGGTVSICIIQ